MELVQYWLVAAEDALHREPKGRGLVNTRMAAFAHIWHIVLACQIEQAITALPGSWHIVRNKGKVFASHHIDAQLSTLVKAHASAFQRV